MIYIQADPPFQTEIDSKRLEEIIRVVLRHENVPDNPDISLVISDNAELQRLNKEFLDIDAPTDVLSFPSDEVDPESGNLYLGDIVISFPLALTQAQQGGHSVEAEIELLLIHGLLHLLRYDHSDPAEKQQMWSVQSDLLKETGNPIKSVPD